MQRVKKIILVVSLSLVAVLALAFFTLMGMARYYASGASLPELDSKLIGSLSAESREAHQFTLLDNGIASLHQRLRLIESAQKSIELEFFIFNVDEAARLVTQALIKKADEGVKVRVLVDFSAPVFQLRPIYARFLKEHGIEVKYYNTAPLYRFFSVQHRSHRKLLIVDGTSFLTGGRNIADDYFGLSPHYNFLDSDVQVSGPITKQVVSSFDLYWNSPLAVAAESIDDQPAMDELSKAEEFFLLRADDEKQAKAISAAGYELTKGLPSYECRDVVFVTDLPEKGERNRRVFGMLSRLLSEAKEEVWAESPYFVIKEGGYELLQRVRDNGAKLKVLTNSLYSTDAYYTVAALYPDLDWIAESGVELSAYDGAVPQRDVASLGLPLPVAPRWGIHSKRAVVDRKTVLIGTYNADPRSANLNSELMLVCRNNPAFAQAVLESIKIRARNSKQVVADGAVINRKALLGQSHFDQDWRFVLSMPFASIFDFLL